jgi:hypothetical protein
MKALESRTAGVPAGIRCSMKREIPRSLAPPAHAGGTPAVLLADNRVQIFSLTRMASLHPNLIAPLRSP